MKLSKKEAELLNCIHRRLLTACQELIQIRPASGFVGDGFEVCGCHSLPKVGRCENCDPERMNTGCIVFCRRTDRPGGIYFHCAHCGRPLI